MASPQGDREVTPTSSGDMARQVIIMLSLGAVYIVISAGLIAFNKYLINPDRFPFAVSLVLCHAGFSSLMALLLLLVKPSLFPSFTDPSKKISIDAGLVCKGALPIAVLFSAQLVLSNTAYLHSSTAFLQMLKESNLVLVYVFSLVASLEAFTWLKARIIVLILIATCLTIEGELAFSMTGFVIQGTSQLFESSKIVLQAMLLSAAGRKLDALSYVLLVMPCCFLILGGILAALVYAYPMQTLQTPAMSDLIEWWPMLLANACVAFALNVTVALFMKNSSAVAFILAGISKDAVIVLAGGAFLGELVSGLQVFAFIMQLCLIWTWSMMKMFPDKFENGVMPGFYALIHGDETKSPAQQDAFAAKSNQLGSSLQASSSK